MKGVGDLIEAAKEMNLEDAHRMADHIEQDIRDRLSGTSVTIHLEPCDGDCEDCLISSCNLRLKAEIRKEGRPDT